MKKLIILALSFCLLSMSVPIKAETNGNTENENCEPCKIKEDLTNVIYQDQVYDKNGELQSFTAIVPLTQGEIPARSQQRSIIGAIVSIVVGTYKACRVTFYTTGGFNPCTYLAAALGRKVVNGVIQWSSSDKGNWDVTQTSHFGKIPGCEPMYSYGCNGWYYTYSYRRV